MYATTLVLALAASASAAVLPRQETSQYGSWDVSLTATSAANGYKSRSLTSVYSNTAENVTSTVQCSYTYEPWNTPAEASSCDNDAFSYDLGLNTISVTQTVELSGTTVTLSGESPIETPCGGGSGRVCSGEATIQASTAVA